MWVLVYYLQLGSLRITCNQLLKYEMSLTYIYNIIISIQKDMDQGVYWFNLHGNKAIGT